MPIDIITAFNRAVNSTANKSAIGYLIGHPLWMGIITTICIIMIALWYEIDGVSCRSAIYLGAIVVGAFVAHDIMLTGQLRETFDVKSGVDLVKNLRPVESTFQPRTMNLPPPQTSMSSTGMASTGMTSTGMTPQNIDDEFAFLRGV